MSSLKDSGKEGSSTSSSSPKEPSLHVPTNLTSWQSIFKSLLIALTVQGVLFGLHWAWQHWVLGKMSRDQADRYRTLGSVVYSVLSTGVWITFVINALTKFGLSLKPLLAAAGVLGVALGFGAQTLVKDIMSGIFILTENQINLGDVVSINEETGTVKRITLRYLKLKTPRGASVYISNGSIQTVINHSQSMNVAKIDILLPYSSSLDRCQVEEEIARLLAHALTLPSSEGGLKDLVSPEPPSKDPPSDGSFYLGGCLLAKPGDKRFDTLKALRGKVFINGITSLSEQGATLQVNINCAPGAMWTVQNTVNALVERLYHHKKLSPPTRHEVNTIQYPGSSQGGAT